MFVMAAVIFYPLKISVLYMVNQHMTGGVNGEKSGNEDIWFGRTEQSALPCLNCKAAK
jgi:hypothetical protein